MNSTSPIPTPLSETDVKRYEETGVLFPIIALDGGELERFRGEVNELEASLRQAADRTFFGECHVNFKWAYDLCTHSKILDVIEQIIGPNILVHSTTLFSKPPGKKFISWHQDSAYWHLSEPRLVSAWVALGDSAIENGCMRVQPGTHFSLLDFTEVLHENNMLGTGNTVVDGLDESLAIDVTLKAGEMSLHHANLLHGSNANRSDGNRVGFAIRYVATDVRQGRGHQEVLLARGENRHGNFELLKNPARLSVSDGIPVHREFTARLNQRELDKGATATAA
ncbi:MAG: non-heme Fe2+,alpha-ketoglutarate-dependent halogenase [Candidatus Binatia bacterium]|jgi:non-heme Fe2+,alpha-ketoglutarate-dependent halogenase